MAETEFDKQVLAFFGQMRIEDDSLRTWVVDVLRAKSASAEKTSTTERDRLQRELTKVIQQKERLLQLRLLAEIETETFAINRQNCDRKKLACKPNSKP